MTDEGLLLRQFPALTFASDSNFSIQFFFVSYSNRARDILKLIGVGNPSRLQTLYITR